MTKFLRRSHDRYSKLGKGRKKKQKWRNPTGRDNKIREKRRGYSPVVSIGYKTNSKKRGNLKGKIPFIIMNLDDLKKIKQNEIAVIGKIGKKKKIEISKKAQEMKISLFNINPKIFLKKNKMKEKKVEKKEPKTEKTKENKK